MGLLKRISDRAKALPRHSNLTVTNFLHQSSHKQDYQDINRILVQHHNNGGLNNPIQPYKLWSLQRLLEQHKPKSVIEFGSGLSTYILSEYAKKTGARILSLDEEERWAENARQLIKNPSVEVIARPRVLHLDRNPPEIKYDFQTTESFDMALIDGPNGKVNGKRTPSIYLNAFDLPELPKVILVDGRTETAQYIAKMAQYEAHLSDFMSSKIKLPGYNHFSVFIRKN